MSAETYYFVCDKCGNLANITDAPPMPEDVTFACDECACEALWMFTDKRHALDHSALVLERRRRVGSC